MGTFITVITLFFSLGGIVAPVTQPDGQGGQLVYDWTGEKSDCRNVAESVISPSGENEVMYFCVLKG